MLVFVTKNLCAFSVSKNIVFVMWITFITVNIYSTYIYIFDYITFLILQSTLKILPVFISKTAYISQQSNSELRMATRKGVYIHSPLTSQECEG